MQLAQKKKLRQKRIWRIRNKVSGTTARPRLCVHFSNKHIYAQLIDDVAGQTLLGLGTLNADLRGQKASANVAGAKALGARLAAEAVAKGHEKVVFDRNGRLFHGAVKAFAEAAREAGLKF